MESLGCCPSGAVAIGTAPGVSRTTFAVLEDNGTVSVWDTRLKTRRFLSVANVCQPGEALELRFEPDTFSAHAMAGRSVFRVDTRYAMAVCGVFQHPTDLSQFYASPTASDSTLVIDDDGHIIPLHLATSMPTTEVESEVFGTGARRVCSARGHFGSLPNICCGLGSVAADGADRGDESKLLCAVSMDGSCAVYSDASDAARHVVEVHSTLVPSGSRQVINPPLPASCAFDGSHMAIGRGDGVYSVYQREEDTIVEVFAAPGHEGNGLAYVAWLPSKRLLTGALSGEISVWDLRHDLEGGAADDDADDLPPLVFAGDLRHTRDRRAVLNGGAVLSTSEIIVGDDGGGLTLCTVTG